MDKTRPGDEGGDGFMNNSSGGKLDLMFYEVVGLLIGA